MPRLTIKVKNTFDTSDPESSFVFVQKGGTSTPDPLLGLSRGSSKNYHLEENQYLDIWSKKNVNPIRCTFKIRMSENKSFEGFPFKLDLNRMTRQNKWTVTNLSDSTYSSTKNINVNVGDDDQ